MFTETVYFITYNNVKKKKICINFMKNIVSNRTYYNEHCIKRSECQRQKSIVANCEGHCGDCKR